MQIESGKYYLTRDGRKVGPMSKKGISSYPWSAPWLDGALGVFWSDNGDSDETTNNDLIAEWQDEPTTDEPDLAALAAQHRIKITVQVGEVIVEYDGGGCDD